MARNRIIKPEFWDDEKLCTISRDARLIFIGLLTNSDDYGVVKGHAGWLKSRIFPYDEDLSLNKFKDYLLSLEKINVIYPFTINSEKYYFIKNFLKHQTIDKPSKNRNPEPPQDILLGEHSDSTIRTLDYEVEVKRSEVKRREEKRSRRSANLISAKVSFDEWKEYVTEEYGKLLLENDWIIEQEKKYPKIDIIATLKEEIEYWAGIEGYEKKHGSLGCNWKTTFYNACKSNWRVVPRSPGKGSFEQQKEAFLRD